MTSFCVFANWKRCSRAQSSGCLCRANISTKGWRFKNKCSSLSCFTHEKAMLKEWYLKINIWVQHSGRLSVFAHFMQLLLWRYWTRLCWRHWSLGTIHCYVFNLYNEASSLLSIFGANNRNELNSKLWPPTNDQAVKPFVNEHFSCFGGFPAASSFFTLSQT